MKLLSFTRQGQASFGVLKSEQIVDVGSLVREKYPTLRSFLANGGVGSASQYQQTAKSLIDPNDVEFLPAIPDPAKIICIGLNYAAHAAESGNPPPPKPPVFVRWPDSLVGHGQPLQKPRESDRFDWEVELCVVIGKKAHKVSATDALSYVAGYTILNDASVRDWQRHTGQYTPGKNFYHSGSVGPWIVTTDELPDASSLRVQTRLNGKVMQDSNTSDLIFNIPQLIEYLTTFTPLEPGDLIATGTPSGVGNARKPPIYMKAGDIIEFEIDQIGTLRNPVVAAA